MLARRSARAAASQQRGAAPARMPGAHGAARPPRLAWSAQRARFARPVRPGGEVPPARSIRGMLMTPWLSAGAGIVVAAGLALNLPHAVLSYRPNYPGTTCLEPACGPAPRHSPGGLTATDPGIKFKHGGHRRGHQWTATGVTPATAPGTPDRTRRPAARRGAAVHVRYQTIQRWSSGFTAVITITSRADLDHWRLAFRYPGAHIDSVAGAKWVARGNGGVLTAVPWPWGEPAGNEVKIMIIANGTPSVPRACRFDRARCQFDDISGSSDGAGGSNGAGGSDGAGGSG
jgi:hypothetical protein